MLRNWVKSRRLSGWSQDYFNTLHLPCIHQTQNSKVPTDIPHRLDVTYTIH